MVLIFFLILPIIYSRNAFKQEFIVYDNIPKEKTITIRKDGYCVYFDTTELNSEEKQIEVNIRIYGGDIRDHPMFYEGTDIKPTINTYVNISYSSTYSNSYRSEDYSVTYTYNIPRLNERYLYLSFPSFSSGLDGYAEIRINNKLSSLAIGLIIGGVFFFIALVLVFAICFGKFEGKKHGQSPSEARFARLVVPPSF